MLRACFGRKMKTMKYIPEKKSMKKSYDSKYDKWKQSSDIKWSGISVEATLQNINTQCE